MELNATTLIQNLSRAGSALHWAMVCRPVCPAMALALMWLATASAWAADIDFRAIEPHLPIRILASDAIRRMDGVMEVYQLRNCRIHQGELRSSASEAVVWVERAENQESDKPTKVVFYLEGDVLVEYSSQQKLVDKTWMGKLLTFLPVNVEANHWKDPDSWSESASVHQAVHQSLPNLLPAQVRPAQFENLPPPAQPPLASSTMQPTSPYGGIEINPSGEAVIRLQPTWPGSTSTVPQASGIAPVLTPSTAPMLSSPSSPSPGFKARSFVVSGRTSQAAEINFIQRPERGDNIATISKGMRIKIDGAQSVASDGSMIDLGGVLLEADRAVVWTRDFGRLISSGVGDEPIEIYLEGNIVFQQGQRVIYADRMYYNVQSEYGMVLSAEILTPAPQYEGLLRLKADVVQQRSRQSFIANNAALTSSRMGVPRYWLQAGKVELTDQRAISIDPITGNANPTSVAGSTGMEADARNNFVYLAGVPVLYWPVLSTNIDRPTFYLTGFKFKNDSIFGAQAMLDWDLYQLLSIDGIDGTEWTLSTDYLSKRGFALGTNFNYDLPNGILPGPTAGLVDFWGIQDRGLDTLGLDRINLVPEETTRGRGLLRHRKYFSQNLELTAEVGWISDRNFLEQYFEREWDQEKDLTTGLRLRRYDENRMLDIWAQTRINDFFTETEWLPRIDHYWLGQSLFDRATWYSHASVAYAHQRIASTPTDPVDAAKFAVPPQDVDAEGIRAITRQELDFPLNAGAFKFVPFLSGEAGHWGEAIDGNELTRLTGQAGIRASLPMWRSYPNIESRLLNLNGLAHKVTWQSEIFYADSDKNFSQLPLFDPIDDNSQEHFRRRLISNTFGGLLPEQFESRQFAIRQGMQRYVTATSSEIVEDQLQARIGVNQRWQTKRGAQGRERIADVVEFDVDMILFPKAERDNFGEEAGAFNYDFRYHIGDRVTLMSDGYFDVFSQGLKIVTIGSMIGRPGRGELYFGLTSLEGPISSLVASTNINYRMSDKWIANFGTAFDLGEVGNVGQSLGLTRIGESFLTRVGMNVDSGRDNVSFQFSLEPRFFSKRLGFVGGQLIPPAGLTGLE